MTGRRRVAFDHFWDGLVPDEWYVPILGLALGVDPEVGPGDITVTSVFPTRGERVRRRLRRGHRPLGGYALVGPPAASRYRIWRTDENVRPLWHGYDLTLSHDVDDYGGRNLYVPLAVQALDWFPERRTGPRVDQRRSGVVLSPRAAASAREPVAAERVRFACAFVSNPEPRRMYAIERLSRYREVDVFGAAVGRPVPSKADVAQQYRFIVCFENDLYPGYVTEKAVEAWGLGAIPLWSGIDAAGLFRADALVNEAAFASVGAWADYVADLDGSADSLAATASAPLFAQEPDFEPLIARLRADLT